MTLCTQYRTLVNNVHVLYSREEQKELKGNHVVGEDRHSFWGGTDCIERGYTQKLVISLEAETRILFAGNALKLLSHPNVWDEDGKWFTAAEPRRGCFKRVGVWWGRVRGEL